MASSDNGATDPGIRLLLRIGDFVEPLTRFDRGHIALESSQHVSVDVVARQVFRVVFEVQRGDGLGELPAGVSEVADAAALEQGIDAQMASARASVPARLTAWTEAHGEDSLTKPMTADCFTHTNPIGHVALCPACAGKGRTDCPICSASGTVTCEACAGKGSQPCPACVNGEVSCATCKSVGTTMIRSERKVWDDVIDAERVDHVQELSKCPACSGSGKAACGRCGGKALIACATCRGQKTTSCVRCKGSGTEQCATCNGQGKRFFTAQLGCVVRETLEVTARAADPEVKAKLGSLAGMGDILALAATHRATSEANADTVRRDTVTVTPVTSVVVQAGGARVRIHGYGPDQKVFDYANIAGMLLSEDMAALEAALPATRLVPPRATAEMEAALSSVLASEVNASIAANAAKKDMGGIARGLQGVVTGEYLARAGKALTTAMMRSYCAAMAKGPVAALAAPLLIAPLDLLARGGGSGARMAALIFVMLLSFGAGVGAHYWCLRQLQARLRPNGEPKLGPILDGLGLTRICFIVAGVGAAVLTMAIASLISAIVPVAPPALPAP